MSNPITFKFSGKQKLDNGIYIDASDDDVIITATNKSGKKSDINKIITYSDNDFILVDLRDGINNFNGSIINPNGNYQAKLLINGKNFDSAKFAICDNSIVCKSQARTVVIVSIICLILVLLCAYFYMKSK